MMMTTAAIKMSKRRSELFILVGIEKAKDSVMVPLAPLKAMMAASLS